MIFFPFGPEERHSLYIYILQIPKDQYYLVLRILKRLQVFSMKVGKLEREDMGVYTSEY